LSLLSGLIKKSSCLQVLINLNSLVYSNGDIRIFNSTGKDGMEGCVELKWMTLGDGRRVSSVFA